MIMSQLGRELLGVATEIKHSELIKQKKRYEIADCEAQIKKLKERGNYVPKQLRKLENQLVDKIRERNVLADSIRELRIEGKRKEGLQAAEWRMELARRKMLGDALDRQAAEWARQRKARGRR